MRPLYPPDIKRLVDAAQQRATCPSRLVGAVLITPDGQVVTGYEGAPQGAGHCTVLGCALGLDGHCTRAVRAELNCVAYAARRGVVTLGARLYSSADALPELVQAVLLNAGINYETS